MDQRRNSMIMIVTILLVAFFYHFFYNRSDKEKEIIGEVEDQKIYYNDLLNFADKQEIELTENNKEHLLDNLITQKVLLKYAEISGIQDKEIKPQYEKEKEFLRKRLIIDRFYDLQSFTYTNISNKEVKQYFKTNLFYKIRAMNFEKKDGLTHNIAQSAYNKLLEGEPFGEVYLEYFPEEDRKNPGFVGVMDLEDMGEELKAVLDALKKPGEFSKPIETKDFISIYYKDDYPKYSEAKSYIFKKLYLKKKEAVKEQQYQKILNSITINYYLINQLYERNFALDAQIKYESLAISNLTNTKMTPSDFLKKIEEYYGISDLKIYAESEIQEFVKGLFIQDVVLDYAKLINFENNIYYQKELRKELRNLEEKMTEEALKLIVTRLIGDVDPSIGEIQEEYYNSSDIYRKSVLFKIQEILVRKKETAQKVLDLAKKGTDFDTLVETYSEDESKNYNNGKTGYLDEYDLKDEYKKFLKYQSNDIMELRETRDMNYVITKIIDRQNGAMKSLDLVRNEIISRIIYKKIKVKVDEIIDKYDLYVKKYPQRMVHKKARKVRLLKGFK